MLRKIAFLGVLLLAAAFVAQRSQPKQPAARRVKPVADMPGTVVFQEDFEKGIEGWTSRPAGAVKWIDDSTQAHDGRGCVVGSVDADKQANVFERELTFDQSSIYSFLCWARSNNPRGKLALFLQQGDVRQSLSAWQDVGEGWGEYRCQFTVPRAGQWRLQFLLPTSNGAPPCTIWADDIQITETRITPSVNLTRGEGYNTEPLLAIDTVGSIWISWLSYRDGRDVLMSGRLAGDANGFTVGDSWPVDMPEGSSILGSTLASDREGAWLVFASEVGKNWDIYTCRIGLTGPAKPQRFTTDKAVQAKPAATVFRDDLWIAWESNQDGARQIYVGSLKSPKPQRVSQPDVNGYGPAIAASAGSLWIAWHAFVDGNYDIYGRRLTRGGEAGLIQRLTRDAQVDRHAQLLAANSGLWVAWQREVMSTGSIESTRAYRTGTVTTRQTRLCRWSANGLEAAAGLDRTILPNGTEMPTLAADARDRIWVTARRARGQNMGWDSVLQCYAGGEWSQPMNLSTAVGWDGAAAIISTKDRILVAYQVGQTPVFRNVEESFKAASNIYLAAAPLDKAPEAAPAQVEKPVEDTNPHRIAVLRKQLGEDTPRRSIDYKGEKLLLFWGDFHEHTSISICNRWRDTSPDDNHANERDIVHVDFTAMTDHDYNYCPALWNHMSKIVRMNYDAGRFVTFLAEEWTSSFERYSEKHPEGYYGHRNLILADPYFPRWYNANDESTPRQVWEDLIGRRANFVHIPHQLADTGNVPTDWDFTDKAAQPVAEIFQTRQSYECKGAPRQAERTIDGYFLQDAWARGIVIGAIASPDHGGGQGKAAIYAPELTREALLDAIRARRCYGTTAARVFLDVRVNGSLMGEEIQVKRDQPIVVTAKVLGAGEVDRVELCRSNKFIYSKAGEGEKAGFVFTDTAPIEGRSYYYVRVQQKDGELAWSSPVWVTRQ